MSGSESIPKVPREQRLLLGRSVKLGELFPTAQFGKADYVLAAALLASCFVLFFHGDIWNAGWDSLNFLFGNPLALYENIKKIRGSVQGASYPPSIYLIFAIWMYPLKLFGWIANASTFPQYWVYWLKTLTTLVYIGTGAIFYRVCLEYVSDKAWAKYATAAWLAMPLALFSEFIFCQFDVFYVLLTLAGFLMFLRGNLIVASLYFGLGITFKYFPAFVFLPLLLLHEKRLSRLAFCCAIFVAPTLLVDLAYGNSPAFVEGVQHFEVLNRVYAATFDIGVLGLLKVYLLPAAVAVLCAYAYFTETTDSNRMRTAAYLWLVSSILPFILILWHPQWIMFIAPPLVLTSMLHRKCDKFLMLDIVGMLLFVAAVSLIFSDNVDAAMFQGARLGLNFNNSYWMADLFSVFGDRSRNVYYSGFVVYMLIHAILKRELLLQEMRPAVLGRIDYGNIRRYVYIGLATFILPVSVVITKDLREDLRSVVNNDAEVRSNILTAGGSFEQTFIAKGSAIRLVRLPLETVSWLTTGNILVEIIGSDGDRIATTVEPILGSQEFSWHKFAFNSVSVRRNSVYKIRLTSPTGTGIVWWASKSDFYREGRAIVDGIPKDWDFSFRIDFAK